jgi:hypothetical protein
MRKALPAAAVLLLLVCAGPLGCAEEDPPVGGAAAQAKDLAKPPGGPIAIPPPEARVHNPRQAAAQIEKQDERDGEAACERTSTPPSPNTDTVWSCVIQYPTHSEGCEVYFARLRATTMMCGDAARPPDPPVG